MTQTQIGNVSTSNASVLTRGQPQQEYTRSRYATGDAPVPVVHVIIIILFHKGTLADFEAHSMLQQEPNRNPSTQAYGPA